MMTRFLIRFLERRGWLVLAKNSRYKQVWFDGYGNRWRAYMTSEDFSKGLFGECGLPRGKADERP